MNQWNCDYPGCHCTAFGVGGARGLRAIGWEFIPGILRPVYISAKTFCPQHRRDISHINCSEDGVTPCILCAAGFEAHRLQELWPNEGAPLGTANTEPPAQTIATPEAK